MQHGIVTQGERRALFGQGQYLIYFFNGQGIGQAATDFRWLDIRYRVGCQLVLVDKKFKKGAQAGQPPGITA